MKEENTYDDIHALIATYLAEGLSAEDETNLQQWINASSENMKYFRDMQEVWFATMKKKHEGHFDKTDAYKRFLLRTGQTYTKRHPKIISSHLYKIAGVLVLLIISYLSYWQGGERVKNQFADVVIEAPLGSRTKMHLPDGTLVWLNAGTKITYSQGFGVQERNVELTGEAYFEVVKNQKLPFMVKTKELHVNVLGTIFNFRNYLDEEEATVSLLEGKVQIGNIIKATNNLYLSPDQKIFLNKKTGDVRVSKGNVAHMVEWKNGFLFFDEELLTDIVLELERSYNVKITFGDESIKTLRFFGSFERREYKIEEILDILTSTNKLKYKINGKEIELYAK